MASISIPFRFNSGRVTTINDPSRIAEQKIIDVLVTDNYERVMNHSYGASIRQLLFEPIGRLDISDFAIDAQQEMSSNITRVNIRSIDVAEEDSVTAYGNAQTTLGIKVSYSIPLGSPQVLSFKLEPTGTIVEDTPI